MVKLDKFNGGMVMEPSEKSTIHLALGTLILVFVHYIAPDATLYVIACLSLSYFFKNKEEKKKYTYCTGPNLKFSGKKMYTESEYASLLKRQRVNPIKMVSGVNHIDSRYSDKVSWWMYKDKSWVEDTGMNSAQVKKSIENL